MYNNESLGLQRDGTLRGCSVCNATLGRYNAFESSLPAGTISGGAIKTKIAGATFASSSGNIRIVALNAAKTAVDTTANASNIRVEILDASNETGSPDANGCYAGTTVITTTGNQNISSGAGTISPSPQRCRGLPAGAPESVLASGQPDVDWLLFRRLRHPSRVFQRQWRWLAGCQLADRRCRPDLVEYRRQWRQRARRRGPFFINGLVARNGANNTTTNYQGSPIILPGNLILPDPSYCAASGYSCAPGNFSVASWNYSSRYAVIEQRILQRRRGLQLEAEDRTFANVDMADSSKIQRYFNSNAVIYTGRFVPASYQLVLNTPMLQTFGSACAARSFTYLGNRLATPQRPAFQYRR